MVDGEQTVYLDPTHAGGAALVNRRIRGEVVMLNLLRFRAVADYRDFPELAPAEDVPGHEAYRRYLVHTLPFLHASGGSILYAGSGGNYFIGPAGRGWDMALLIRQASVDRFFAFAGDPDYLKGIGHRAAALRDSRLLPLEDLTRDFRRPGLA